MANLYQYNVDLEGYWEPGRFLIKFIAEDEAGAEEHIRWWARHRATKMLRAEHGSDTDAIALALSELPQPSFEQVGVTAVA
jgi:hypothetical protein